MASSDPALDAQQHVARDREHDEGDDEEDEAQRDQRGSIEITDGFGEFVGDGGGNGGARRQQRGRHFVRVADHEGHRHGLAERPAKSQHHAADDPDPRVGQHDVANDLPGGAADAVGRFLEHGRDGIEHVARDRGDEGEHHDRENEASGQHADAIGRAGKQRRQHRDIAESRDQERLQGFLQERREYEQAPDAIDDAGNTRQELDGDPYRPTQPQGAQLGEEHGDQQPDRDRDQHRDERGDEGAVDRRQRAEFLRHRVPALLDEKIQPEGAQRRHRAIDERNNDPAENDQHPDRRGAGENAEESVGGAQPAERLGPRRHGVGLNRVALQRHIDHGSPPGGLHSGSPLWLSRGVPIKRGLLAADKSYLYLDTTREGPQDGALPNATYVSGTWRRAACLTRPSHRPPRSS